jgi:hypothetical protein
MTEESHAGQNEQAPGQGPQQSPYAFYVAAIAIVSPCLVHVQATFSGIDRCS